jgi:hypothetical protein
MSVFDMWFGGIALLAGAIGGCALTMLANHWQQDRQRIAELESKVLELSKPRRAWLDEIRLDARTEVLATAQLMKLSVHDGLDALRRLSPGLAEEVIEDVMRK